MRWIKNVGWLLCILLISWGVSIALGGIMVKRTSIPDLSTTITVSVDEMPQYVGQAFLAIEDHRFNFHFGIDPISIVRSLWIDMKTGAIIQGGSTITMQLARNLYLSLEQTVERKLKEMFIATYLETLYSKQEILSLYVNNIHFGHGNTGIEEAAQFYFQKTTQKQGRQPTITLGEAAMLAALPKAPNLYSPLIHPKRAKQRKELVLHRMQELGWITVQEKQQALAEPLLRIDE